MRMFAWFSITFIVLTATQIAKSAEPAAKVEPAVSGCGFAGKAG